MYLRITKEWTNGRYGSNQRLPGRCLSVLCCPKLFQSVFGASNVFLTTARRRISYAIIIPCRLQKNTCDVRSLQELSTKHSRRALQDAPFSH